jgi:cholesterol oxidase
MTTGTVRFTEEMTGFAWPGAATYREGWDEGQRSDWTLMFHLTIWVDDLDAFVNDPDKEAVADGWVGCPALGGRRPVERGVFNLFVPSRDPKRSNMKYRLWFRDESGAPFTLEGHKDIEDHPGLDTWKDTTTLFTTLRRGHLDPGAEVGVEPFARGILYIRPGDFATQLTTFRGSPRAVARFGRLFASTLWRTYRGGRPG